MRRHFFAVTLAVATLTAGLLTAVAATVGPVRAASADAALDLQIHNECAKLQIGRVSDIYQSCIWVPDANSTVGTNMQPKKQITDTTWNCSPINDEITALYGLTTEKTFGSEIFTEVTAKVGIDFIVEAGLELKFGKHWSWEKTSGTIKELWTWGLLPGLTKGWMEFQEQDVTTTGHFEATYVTKVGKKILVVTDRSSTTTLQSGYYLDTGAPAGDITINYTPMSEADKQAHCANYNPQLPVFLAQPGDRCAIPTDASGAGLAVAQQVVRLQRSCAGSGNPARDAAATWTVLHGSKDGADDGTVIYENRSSSMCLGTQLGGLTPGTLLVQRNCDPAEASQHWRVSSAGPGSYLRLQNVGTESQPGGPLCAMVQQGRLVPGTGLVLGSCTDVSAMWSYRRNEQVWQPTTASMPGGACLAPMTTADAGTAALAPCTGTVDQTEAAQWYLVPATGAASGNWLRSAWTGECLNLWGGNTYLSPCSTQTDMSRFSWSERVPGIGVLTNANAAGNCLGVPGGATAVGSVAKVVACSALGSDWTMGWAGHPASWPKVVLGMPDDRCAVPSAWPTPGGYSAWAQPIRMLPQCGATSTTTDTTRNTATRWYARQLGGGKVALQNTASGFCAGTAGGAVTAGTTVNLTTCGYPGTTWVDTHGTDGRGTYAISGGANTCLATSQGSIAAGTPLVLDLCAQRTTWSSTAIPRRVQALSWADLPNCLQAAADNQNVATVWGCAAANSQVMFYAVALQDDAYQYVRASNPAQCLADVDGSSQGLPDRLQSAPCDESSDRQQFFNDSLFASGTNPGSYALRSVATNLCVQESLGDGVGTTYTGPALKPCVVHGSGQDWTSVPQGGQSVVLGISQDRCVMRDGPGGPGATGPSGWLDLVTPCAGTGNTDADAAMTFTRYDVTSGMLLVDDATGTCLTSGPGVGNALRLMPCALNAGQVWSAAGPVGAQLLSVPAVGPGYTSLCLGATSTDPRWTLSKPATSQLVMASCTDSAAMPFALTVSFARQARSTVNLGQPDDRCLGSSGVLGSQPLMQRPCAGTGTPSDTNAALVVLTVVPSMVKLVTTSTTGCLGAASFTAGSPVTVMACADASAHTVWMPTASGAGTRYQLLGSTALCLSTSGGQLAAGTGAVLTACKTTAIAWTGRDTTMGATTLLAKSGGRCALPTSGGLHSSTTRNQLVYVVPGCTTAGVAAAGATNGVTWSMRPLRAGQFQLVDKASGYCLQTFSGTATAGPTAYLMQTTCNDSVAVQAWTRVADGGMWRYQLAGTSACVTDGTLPNGMASFAWLGTCDANADYWATLQG